MLIKPSNKCFCVEFDRKTNDGFKKWSGGEIYSSDNHEAENILSKSILPFINKNLPDIIFNARVTGELVGIIDTDIDINQPESTKYLEGLQNWFYFPQIDTLVKLNVISEEGLENLLSYFIKEEVFEACITISNIIKTLKDGSK